MRTIINGRKYDTETATMVGENSCGGYSDFHHFEEELYRKKTGEFFLHGDGGPMSRYASHSMNESWGDEKIIPLSEERAREWCEKHLSVNEYEELFGEVEE